MSLRSEGELCKEVGINGRIRITISMVMFIGYDIQ